MATSIAESENVLHTQLSLFHGPSDQPLIELSLASWLDRQCLTHGQREAIVTPWNGARWTYRHLQCQSLQLAKYLHGRGIRPGDRVGILAGNRAEYGAVFFACMRVGAILVILNNTYTIGEAHSAIRYTDCRVLFTSRTIGRSDFTPLIQSLAYPVNPHISSLEVILLSEPVGSLMTYDTAVHIGSLLPDDEVLRVQDGLDPSSTANLQFTSGSTGQPKAAMLTHRGLLNNAFFIGDRMAFTPQDVLCCPPPLFHCFGLVLGLLAVIAHGAKIVYPGEIFDGPATLRAITDERCTALHGVPAMFDTLFSLPRPSDFDPSSLRTGIIAGAPVPRHLMRQLVDSFGMKEFTSSYGLTEASPTCFNATTNDTIERKLATVGKVMPHASAKVINSRGDIVPVGVRGQLCIAGYQVQRGYWNNADKTNEALHLDSDGTIWLHTGDEAFMDEHGYCSITGRFKDIIIRGGENIYPLEIEERLVAHASIERAIVVGVPDEKYGEQVGAFLDLKLNAHRPSLSSIQSWVRETLGWHKAPVHVFWLGDDGIDREIPVTGSGKVKKYEMRDLAVKILRTPRAKL